MSRLLNILKHQITLPILGGIILLLTVLITISDWEVSNRNSLQLVRQNLLNNHLIILQGLSQNRIRYELLSNLNVLFLKSGIYFDPRDYVRNSEDLADPEFRRLSSDFKEGRIDASKFLGNMAQYYAKKTGEVNKIYNEEVSIFNDELRTVSPWSYIKNILTFIQVIFVIMTIIIPAIRFNRST